MVLKLEFDEAYALYVALSNDVAANLYAIAWFREHNMAGSEFHVRRIRQILRVCLKVGSTFGYNKFNVHKIMQTARTSASKRITEDKTLRRF